MRVRRQTLSGRFVRKPSSGNKIADPAGTWTKVWSQWREHLGCPGLATLGPLPVPLECEGHRKETIETLRLRGKFLLEIRERESSQRHLLWLPLGNGSGGRERNGGERRQAVPGAVGAKAAKGWRACPLCFGRRGQVSCSGMGSSVGL